MKQIKVIDLFAGPGGLGEGFSSFRTPGGRPFQIVFSAEMEPSAVRTLRLRTFYRLCRARGRVPDSYYDYLRGDSSHPFDSQSEPLWRMVEAEIRPLELGLPAANRRLREGLDIHVARDRDFVLIGGPPCQAYSLVGRARNRGIKGYTPEDDKRHFLYRHYLKVLADYQPVAFVMENVKGILSSSVNGARIFPQILQDLSRPAGPSGTIRYRIHSLVSRQSFGPGDDPAELDPREFVVRAEEYGIPQARHRVILVGIRDDGPATPRPGQLVPVRDGMKVDWAIRSLPPLRSGFSRGDRDVTFWKEQINDAISAVRGGLGGMAGLMREKFDRRDTKEFIHDRGGEFVPFTHVLSDRAEAERRFLRRMQSARLGGVPNHDARGHMVADLVRYLFASTYADEYKTSPKAEDFPSVLAPAHRNWRSGHFADRFRVQLNGRPSTTITSHISKDGHYFIHPDPSQCRSLTVREAARLQTFPDDYLFEGGRTQQYVQVGNAVPPLLAEKIAALVYKAIA